MLATIGNYDDRIRQGKGVEDRIIKNLRARLPDKVSLETPTRDEDCQQKIDFWWCVNGKRYSVQVKFRESGDDLIFEVVKDLDKWTPGRDIISVAQFYLVVDRHGTARLYSTDEIKQFAKKMLGSIKTQLTNNPALVNWSGNGYEVKRTVDRASFKQKLMLFVSPTFFDIIVEWKNLI